MTNSYNCPHCAEEIHLDNHFTYRAEEGTVKISHCSNCEHLCSWCDEKMICPAMPPPHINLPTVVKKAYREAASVTAYSPRCASILLRLAIDLVCDEQECKGKNLETKIEALIKKIEFSKPPYSLLIRWIAHPVRFIGNKSAHEIDFEIDKNPKLVEHLFEFMILIAEVLYVWNKNEGVQQTHETSQKNETPKNE